MFKDHEFDPVTPEEEARRKQEEEFARRVRREVLRIERGEAEEEIRADLEREAAEKAEAEERERRERRRRASTCSSSCASRSASFSRPASRALRMASAADTCSDRLKSTIWLTGSQAATFSGRFPT